MHMRWAVLMTAGITLVGCARPARLDFTVAKSSGRRPDMARISPAALGVTPPTDSSITETYAAFGTALLGAQVRLQGGTASAALSPLSIGHALSLVAAGAADSTAWQMRPALRTRDTTQKWLAGSAKATIEAFARRTDAEVVTANALWVTDRFRLEPPFMALARERYLATVRRERLETREFVQRLNAWADRATRGKVKEIMAEPFDTTTVAVLSTAVHFKAAWHTPFNPAVTTDRPFTTGAGIRRQVPMMQRTASLAYRRDTGFAVLRLPYRKDGIAMYVVLPDSGTIIGAVFERLERHGWPVPDPIRDVVRVRLELPRMRLTTKLDLAPPLTAIGMGIVFDTQRGDLSGIYAPPSSRRCPPLSSATPAWPGCTRVVISKATHDAVIDVDEAGTEAAAVSAIGLGAVTLSLPPSAQPFLVDRPFLFAIRDEQSGAMLFMAYVAEPAP